MTQRATSRQKFTSQGSSSKKLESRKAGNIRLSHCADGSLRHEGPAQRRSLRQQRVENFDAVGVPSTLGEARCDPLQCARGDSLQEEVGVADVSEVRRDVKKRNISGVCQQRTHVGAE